MNLKTLTDESLLNRMKSLVENERKITAEVIKHFFELNRRKLFLARGYDSLFSMLTKEYRYCPASAMLRINAVRLMTDVPNVIDKIESGEMPVSVAANIQSFLNAEAKSQGAYSKEAKVELVEACLGKSVLEVQREFVRRNPEVEKKESVRPISEDRLRVSHSISNSLEEKLQRIKLLWSHVDPNMSREDLLDRMAEITLDRIDPVRKLQRAKKRAGKADAKHTEQPDSEPEGGAKLHASSMSVDDSLRVSEMNDRSEATNGLNLHPTSGYSARRRYIDANADRNVRERNRGGGCEFVHEASGQRCGSHFQLQRDHITPWSAGGSNDAENLRSLCANHNRWRWATRSGSQGQSGQLAFG